MIRNWATSARIGRPTQLKRRPLQTDLRLSALISECRRSGHKQPVSPILWVGVDYIVNFGDALCMSFPGGKGGLFRQLINLIPAHHTYIETHLGDGAVMRNKAAAVRSIGVEIDAAVLARWFDTELPALELVQADATGFLKTYPFRGDEFLYVDPPYVRSSRRSLRVYRHELSDREHLELLQVLDGIRANVMISGYACALYDQRLSHWRRLEFGAGSHGLAHREVVWLNYEPPSVPADLRYAGHSFRERQRIKRKQQRLRQKITDLPPVERAIFLEWVSKAYDGGRRG